MLNCIILMCLLAFLYVLSLWFSVCTVCLQHNTNIILNYFIFIVVWFSVRFEPA